MVLGVIGRDACVLSSPAVPGTLSYRVPARCGRQLPERTPRLHMTAPNPRSNATASGASQTPFSTLLRPLDAVLEPTKQAMLALTATQDANGATNQDGVPWTVQVLRQHLDGLRSATGGVGPEGNHPLADSVDYMGEFSSNMLDILEEEIRTPRPTPGPQPDSQGGPRFDSQLASL